ncbi:hypothetical protein I4U23_023490 [Adineta vaga]|nr:hypothetical protein I4U23_023490 [Adineta vaga]
MQRVISDSVKKWPASASSVSSVADQLDYRLDLTFDKNGAMYVSDTKNCRVWKNLPPSTVGATVVGSGECGREI